MQEPLQVLLIEDNPGDSDLITEMLTKETYSNRFNVVCIQRLSEGIERLKQDKFDIVLLDLGLPDSAGFDTVDKFKRISQETPFIVLTGLVDEDTGMASIKAGAQDYIIKDGLSSQHLASSIRYAIERHQLIAERETLIEKLEKALDEVKTLSGIIPICVNCKKVRNDQGYWEQVEVYIREHSRAELSYGLCPECSEKLYGGYFKDDDSSGGE